MIFRATKLQGVFEVQIEPTRDERGFFARSWCQKEFESHGLSSKLVQCSISFNSRKGTLRGIHYQAAPHPEAKLVRCTRGAIYDVAVDLRPDSPTFREWISVQLTAANRSMLFVPEGCGHGFLTLEDECEVLYHISEFYHPELARGLRWNDPAVGVAWPAPVKVISQKDRSYPNIAELQ
ncbi:MAG: dTDP-4-dehydrorhamnose 3,5-epimerase [Acidobacteria bacterium]|nr:dTDP-4-dehydrorhamnose 3,5-epimerase [Acidobacteriota bacterium]